MRSDYFVISLISWALVMTLSTLYFSTQSNCPLQWHGGSAKFPGGSCWCGKDAYCLCTPSLAIEGLIEVKVDNVIKVVLVERRDPPKDRYAIPGGFVNVGESAEDAAIREVYEETNVKVTHSQLQQFGFYSNPNRDIRRHTASIVFRIVLGDDVDSIRIIHNIRRGDDAKNVVIVPLHEAIKLNLAFDHYQILSDYIDKFHPYLSHEFITETVM